MFRYGEKVVIRDGSRLDGANGIVYQVRDGQVLVLIDREVFWSVNERRLERAMMPQGMVIGGNVGE